jgi:hypothetical protein
MHCMGTTSSMIVRSSSLFQDRGSSWRRGGGGDLRDSGGGWEMGDGRKGKVRMGKREGQGLFSRVGRKGAGLGTKSA